MAGTQPAGNWQPAQPGGQPPAQHPGGQAPDPQLPGAQLPGAQLPGAQLPGAQFPAPGYGQVVAGPAPGKPRRRRAWVVAAMVVVVAVGGFVAQHAISSTPKGSIVLPGTLLGLPKATSTGAGHLAASLKQKEAASAGSKLSGVKAGIYGTPTGAWLAIAGGGICGTCSPKSVSAIKKSLVKQQYTDATAFPAGTKGGVMACGSKPSGGSAVIRCSWVDDMTAGDVLFLGGSASGLADAAAKTNQARAVVER